MLKSALDIVGMFSGNGAGSDICHVGSALFMGNNIKLMCSNQATTLKTTLCQQRTNTRYTYAPGAGVALNVKRYEHYNIDQNKCPYKLKDG